MASIVRLAKIDITITGLVYIGLAGVIVGILLLFALDRKEQEIVSISTDLKNFKNIF